MNFSEKSKAREIQRLRSAGLSLAHADRLAQKRRGGGAVIAVATGAGLVLAGAITAVTLNLTAPTAQTVTPPAAPVSGTPPLPEMAPLVTPPAPGSFAVAGTAPQPAGGDLLTRAVQSAIAEENAVKSLTAETTATVTPATAPQTTPEPTIVATPDCVDRLETLLQPLFVTFDLGSTDITGANAELLTRISQRIVACEDAYVMVAGHADSSGDDLINMALSWERADRTLDRLVALGVDPNAVEAVGFGARAPLSQGSAEEDSADRRVDFRVLRKREAFR